MGDRIDPTPADPFSVLTDEARLLDPEVIAAALRCCPAPHPDLAQLAVPGGHLLWGHASPIGSVTHLTAAMWPFLDGQLSLGELAVDLRSVILDDPEVGHLVDGEPVERFVAEFGVNLWSHHLVVGMEPLDDLMARRRATPEGPPPVGQYEYVVDGIRYISVEMEVSVRDLKEAVGERASRAELVEPSSCIGKKLHLDRPAVLHHVSVDGECFSVRCGDDELNEMLAELASPEAAKGPVVAFVTHAGAGDHVTFGVYDMGGILVCATADRRRVAAVVAGLVASAADPPDPPGTCTLALRAIVRGRRAVLALLPVVDTPRGLVRALARRGCRVAPATKLFLSDDGRDLLVPSSTSPLADPDDSGRFEVAGIWVAGNRPAEVAPVHLAHGLLVDSGRATVAQRLQAMRAVAAAVERHPHVLSFRTDSSSPRLADKVAALLE